MRSNFILFILAAGLAGATQTAVDVPAYIATHSISSTKTGPGGHVISQTISTSEEARSLHGSKYQRNSGDRKYSLFVASEPGYYTIDEIRHVAIKRFSPDAGSWRMTTLVERLARAKTSTGTGQIAGILCYVFPVKSNIPGVSMEICHDLQDDIVLQEKQSWVDAGGNTITNVDMITDLKLGVSPEPSLVTLPPGFAVEQNRGAESARPGTACVSCGRR